MNLFINEIKHKMIDENITEEKLAHMIGCSEVSLNKWLSEKEEMPVMIYKKKKKTLNIMKSEDEKNLKDLADRFSKLSDENKNKVLEYIEFLQYSENKLKLSMTPSC